MSVAVLFFASLREQVGREQISLPADEVPDLPSLLARLDRELGDVASHLHRPSVRVALNQSLLDTDDAARRSLKDGDEVAFLPPITGG